MDEPNQRSIEEWFRSSEPLYEITGGYLPLYVSQLGGCIGVCLRGGDGLIISALIMTEGACSWSIITGFTRPFYRDMGYFKHLVVSVIQSGYSLEIPSNYTRAGLMWLIDDCSISILIKDENGETLPWNYDLLFDGSSTYSIVISRSGDDRVTGKRHIGRYMVSKNTNSSEHFSESGWSGTPENSRVVSKYHGVFNGNDVRVVLTLDHIPEVIAMDVTGPNKWLSTDSALCALDALEEKYGVALNRKGWSGGFIDHVFIKRSGSEPEIFRGSQNFFSVKTCYDYQLRYNTSGDLESFSINTGHGSVIFGLVFSRMLVGDTEFRLVENIYEHPAYTGIGFRENFYYLFDRMGIPVAFKYQDTWVRCGDVRYPHGGIYGVVVDRTNRPISSPAPDYFINGAPYTTPGGPLMTPYFGKGVVITPIHERDFFIGYTHQVGSKEMNPTITPPENAVGPSKMSRSSITITDRDTALGVMYSIDMIVRSSYAEIICVRTDRYCESSMIAKSVSRTIDLTGVVVKYRSGINVFLDNMMFHMGRENETI